MCERNDKQAQIKYFMLLQFVQRNYMNSNGINQENLFLILAKLKAVGKQGNTSRVATLLFSPQFSSCGGFLPFGPLCPLPTQQPSPCPGRLTVQTASASFFAL